VAARTTESGWKEAPRLKDMTEIRFGQSTCQIAGTIVPSVEIDLAAGDEVYFEHHVLLWKESEVPIRSLPLRGVIKRTFAGMPFVVSAAYGEGRAAFSRDATGEVVVLPLQPDMEIDVREHAFLLASSEIEYTYVLIQGLRPVARGALGVYMDRFWTRTEPGILFLHGYGNVFEKTLAPNDEILLEPGAFLYKDASVKMEAEMRTLPNGLRGGVPLNLLCMTGPGRVGIQSMYFGGHRL
jgi:uncharacterized protein (AIM24 family)